MNIEASVRSLVDRAEISDLMLSFGAALDSRDWDAYADTFIPDGRFTILGNTRHGRAEIAAGPRRDLDHFGNLQHFLTNPRVEVTGDEARASFYLLAVHVFDRAEPSIHADIGARYDCRCVRTAQGWRLAEVDLTAQWSAGKPFVLANDAQADAESA
jgi:uncharacterized protein (TIGR02246 family)